ncbi:MAG TPA: pilus assembly protein PilB, partial [Cyanobacteria bacterium UBA11166]|nr:pilus assembly protein PilB [Cyanobacteria bacterium UBA11166]
MDNFQILKRLYNNFDPFRALPAGDPTYVDCHEVRGDCDILEELGQPLLLSERVTCNLYSGHRGAGKSTELLRLKDHLEKNSYYVVYFAADEEDIDPEDAQYTDILLACTRRLLESLKDNAKPDPLLNWLKTRWQSLKELALTEVSFETLSLETQILQFAKLTANLRAVPATRQKIRQQIDTNSVSLIEALNEFIIDAKKHLPNGASELLVIADNLDRIVPIYDDETKRSNHDQIFLDRCEQLSRLNCHTIYTVPISMVYSDRGTVLEDRYSKAQVLPMIMVQKPTGEIYQAGIDKLKELIGKRVDRAIPGMTIDQVFETTALLENLCLISGGHVRNLMLLMKTVLQRTSKLPIS